MAKTQAPYGSSLAQIYDTIGTKIGAGADLRTDEIALVHEMGHVIFSERLQFSIRHLVASAVAQSTAIAVVITDLPTAHYRILNATVFTTSGATAAHFSDLSLHQRDVSSGREIPFWTWDLANGGVVGNVRVDLGSGVVLVPQLIPSAAAGHVRQQSMGRGFVEGAPPGDGVRAIALRGTTAAFGAGTLDVTAAVLIAHALPGPGQIRSEGLPIPSW